MNASPREEELPFQLAASAVAAFASKFELVVTAVL
jgi:hypothetical protein